MKMTCKKCGREIEGSAYDMKQHHKSAECCPPELRPPFDPKALLTQIVDNEAAINYRRDELSRERAAARQRIAEIEKELDWMTEFSRIAEENQPPLFSEDGE